MLDGDDALFGKRLEGGRNIAELQGELCSAQVTALEGLEDLLLFDGVFARGEICSSGPQRNPPVVDFPRCRAFQTPIPALRAHHARYTARRCEQAHACRKRRDVAAREPLRAGGALLVEIRMAHGALDVLELGGVKPAGDGIGLAFEKLDHEADHLPPAQGDNDRTAHAYVVIAWFDLFRHAIRIGRVERLRGDVEYDRCEFHALKYTRPRRKPHAARGQANRPAA